MKEPIVVHLNSLKKYVIWRKLNYNMADNQLYPTYHSDQDDDRNIVSEPYITWELQDAASKISRGLFTDILVTIQNRLKITNLELAELLQISPRTLDRRRKEKTLPADESERSYRIARLTELAIQVFEDPEKVSAWFAQPNFALGNQKPLDLMKSEPGARLVERLLRQIDHGITV
jgi:putative toxin-antitoxin system antitoxin component (TIGR02293 family)